MTIKPPSVLVIFGSTGNLVQKKLIPALYNLSRGGFLPAEFTILCVARDPGATVDSIIQQSEMSVLRQATKVDNEALGQLKSHMRLIVMDSTNIDDYVRLRDKLDQLDSEKGIRHNRLYYLAIPPSIFTDVIKCLGMSGLNDESAGAARRILVEKPVGVDLQSAHQILDHIGRYFQESQVYRIDHYLAKETAQNILTLRYNNPIIEDLWSRRFIDHIQITATETIDIEGRANFYDNMGALRDIVQSHLLQLMALTMMEVPHPMNYANIHGAKLALLNSIKPIKLGKVDSETVRGQYAGYKDEAKNADSHTETFAALRFQVANSRWRGVPVLMRTGKALADQMTEINIVFKDRTRRDVAANVLSIRIQPNEGISIGLLAKKPGFVDKTQRVHMNFCYETSFAEVQPTAYERVLVDAIIGDQTLFATNAEVLRCWDILDSVIKRWRDNSDSLIVYEKGSWGPDAAVDLAKAYGCEWLFNALMCTVSPKKLN